VTVVSGVAVGGVIVECYSNEAKAVERAVPIEALSRGQEMRRPLYCTWVCCLVLASCNGENAATSEGAADSTPIEVKKLPPVRIDDDVSPRVLGEFRVLNRTGKKRSLREMVKSCSCLQAELSPKDVEPEGEAVLRVSIDMRNRFGNNSADCTLVWSDGESERFRVEVFGYARIYVSPGELNFGSSAESDRDSIRESRFTVVLCEQAANDLSSEISIDCPDVDVTQISSESLRPATGLVARSTLFGARLKQPQSSGAGESQLRLRVTAPSGQPIEKVVPLVWRSPSGFTVSPRRVVDTRASGTFKTFVVIRRVEGHEQRITEVESSNPAIQATLEPAVEGAEDRITVEVSPASVPSRIATGVLRIRTSDPREPLITVPVAVRFTDANQAIADRGDVSTEPKVLLPSNTGEQK
jgi:hypothetical protein